MKNKEQVCLVLPVVVMLVGVIMSLLVCSRTSLAKEYTENDMVFNISREEAVLVGCTAEEDTIKVPDSVNGYPVTRLGNYAFYYSKYKRIQLPETVTEIGHQAFCNCENLESITLPKNLKTLGSSAFLGCGKLQTVTMGDKVKEIESNTFAECISLKSIRLSRSLRRIEEKAFWDCYKLSGIKLSNQLTYIGEYAFSNNYKMTSIVIPTSVKNVDQYAFRHCKRLTSVVFKNKNTKLSEGLFYKCSALTKVVLPKNLKTIPENLFQRSGLKTFQLPAGVSIIKAGAFRDCFDLKSFKMNSRVYAVGDRAFANSGLKTIQLNSKMQYIGNGAFSGTNIRKMSLPDKVTYIGNRVFANCHKLSAIRIPASVKGINPGAFNNCDSLQSIEVASGNKNYSSRDGVLYNKGMSKLIQYPLNKKSAHFSVPGSVKTIRANAFEENSHLCEVSVSASYIGTRAFASMPKLRKVVLLNGVKTISESAFRDNSELKILTISDSVQKIGYSAFENTSITSVHIPASLKNLNSSAFYGCYRLKEFTGGRGGKYRVVDGVLYDGKQTKLILYPAKKKGTEFDLPSSVKSLGSHAFYNVKNLKKIYFNKKIKYLPYSCINHCPNLRSVVFAGGTKLSTGYSAIYNCDRLAVIVGPNKYIFKAMAKSAGATLITL